MLTDRHALAVMIYMYLLYRHPLKGGNYFGTGDTVQEDMLMMGQKALFIEHSSDHSNRPKQSQLDTRDMPWADPNKIPYTICGPYLKDLFNRAFIEGLHHPARRPTAEEWKDALIKTFDLLQPCQNANCEQKWFAFDNTRTPRCPFCGTEFKGQLPVLDLYYRPAANMSFRLENHRIMVYTGQNLYLWQTNRNFSPNERLSEMQRRPVADFHFHSNRWILVNRTLTSMYDVSEGKQIQIGEFVELVHGKQILFSKEDGGRLVNVSMVNN
jgi:hypothetical protein